MLQALSRMQLLFKKQEDKQVTDRDSEEKVNDFQVVMEGRPLAGDI